MPPDNQQSSPQPDYSFITNQPLQDNGDRKANKKFIILGSLVVALLVATIIGTVLNSAQNKVKQKTDISTAYAITEQYFKALSEYRPNDAYKLLTTETQKAEGLEFFTKNTANVFVNTVDLKNCRVENNEAQKTEANTKVECPSLTNKKLVVVFDVVTKTESSQYRISKYTINTKEKES